MKRLLTATVLCAVADGLWAVALATYNGRAPMSVWNGVASVGFGPEMLQAGARGTAIGLAMHVGVAFTWSLIFVTLLHNLPALQRLITRPVGVALASLVYGPLVWTVMSAVVTPSLTGNALVVTSRWFVQAAGHVVFVGLPIVLGARRR
jgi:hypothetical protein